MRIHKLIQLNLDERKKEEKKREFIAAQEAELANLLQASDLQVITFRKGWWIFSNWYRIEVDSRNRIHYRRHDQGAVWTYCNKKAEQLKLLKYLMT